MAKRRSIDITYNAQTATYKRQVNDAEKFTLGATKRMQGSANLLKTASSRLALGFGGITAGGFALTSVVTKGVDSFLKLDKGMRNVNTIIKVSETQLASYTKQLEKLQSELGVSTEDLTNGFYQAVSAGISAGDAIQFLTTASKASIAGISSVEVAVDGLTNVINAFHLSANDATKVSDIMFKTVELGKTNFEQLATSISEFAPMAYSLGLSFEQTAGALATITKQGVTTAEAGTQLNAVFTGVLKGQERAQTMSKAVADAFSIQALKTKGLQKFLQDLYIALDGDQEAMVKLFGRAEAVKGMLQLTGNNAKMASKDFNAMTNAIGAMNKAFEEQEKSKSKKIEKFFERINVGVQGVIHSIEPAIDDVETFTTVIKDLLTTTDEYIKKIAESIQGAVKDAFDVSVNPTKGIIKGGKGLDFSVDNYTDEMKNNLKTGRQFIPGTGWITVKKDVKETNIETNNLVKTFSMYNATQDEINNRITELRDLRKDLVVWSTAYINNLKEEQKLSKYLTDKPINYTPFGSVDAKGGMFGDTESMKLNRKYKGYNFEPKLVGEKYYRHSDKTAVDLFGEEWIANSLADEQKLFDDMIINASELGYVINDAFNVDGNNILSTLNQALQVALNISKAINLGNQNDWSFGSLLGLGASIVPGLGLFSNLFGGEKASGGNVSRGYFYKVNENGTELFSSGGNDYLMMGGSSGNITPHERINLGNYGGSGNTALMKQILNSNEAQTHAMYLLNDSYKKGMLNTKLEAEISNRQTYLSNKNGTKKFNRYH